jgi:Cys-tRNA(Pro) deacylase
VTAELHPNARRVAEAAARAGLVITVHEYPDGTRTAHDAAAAVGCDVAQIVKSLVFDAAGSMVVALTSGANRVDTAALARAVGVDRLDRADAERVREVTGFPIGGVPPFGHRQPVPCWVDEDLLVHDQVWAAAGTPRHVFPLPPTELVRLTGATVAFFAERPAG